MKTVRTVWALRHQRFYFDHNYLNKIDMGKIEIGECVPLPALPLEGKSKKKG